MQESFNQLLFTLTNGMWYVVILSTVIALVAEHEAVWEMYQESFKSKGKPLEAFQPVIKRLIYVAFGILIVSVSYAVMAMVTIRFDINQVSGMTEVSQARLFGLSVALLMVSGYTLALSGGNKWLLTLTKLLVTAAFGAVMTLVIGSYLL